MRQNGYLSRSLTRLLSQSPYARVLSPKRVKEFKVGMAVEGTHGGEGRHSVGKRYDVHRAAACDNLPPFSSIIWFDKYR